MYIYIASSNDKKAQPDFNVLYSTHVKKYIYLNVKYGNEHCVNNEPK